MGGAVSAGADNDELVDNLVEADYIKTAAVERVFRAVDRGHYFTLEFKESAYRDLAWKCGNLHISAPCIYSEVMENLKLAPGMSFLNLGSGTGYLSTMAGLILGSYGINHGIEIHEDVVHYAGNKLDEFISTSSAIDEYEFCQPKFVYGNCLYLGNGARQYDRVYCGAACPENHENYMKNLIKVGGILIMPINDQLLQIIRTSDTNWESKSVLPVSFATLISGKTQECYELLKMPDTDPLSLQDICRFVVRSILRRNIDMEHPELKRPQRVPRKRVKKKTLNQLVIPIFNSNSDGEEDADMRHRGLFMDVNNVQTLRSVIELSHILRAPSISVHNQSVNDTETRCNAETNSHETSTSTSQEMSDEEFLSEFEELHNMLRITGKTETPTSTGTCGSSSEGGNQEQPTEAGDSIKGKKITKNNSKQEKINSEIVEDIKAGKDVSSHLDHDEDEEMPLKPSNSSEDKYPFLKVTDSDTDTESCENSQIGKVKTKKSDPNLPPVDSSPVNVINYSTYMKEKIKMLPLPMTLKYFLNLNREL